MKTEWPNPKNEPRKILIAVVRETLEQERLAAGGKQLPGLYHKRKVKLICKETNRNGKEPERSIMLQSRIKKLKKGRSAVLLSLTFVMFTVVLAVRAAAATTATVYMVTLPRGGGDGTAWSQPALTFMNGWTFGATSATNVISTGSYTGRSAYCIEPGIGIHTGDILTLQETDDYWMNFPSNQSLTGQQIETLIGRVINYGWQGNNSTSWSADNSTHVQQMAEHFATRLLVWEVIVGERDLDFEHVDTGSFDQLTDSIRTDHPFRSEIFEHYDRIVEEVKIHGTIPSFMSPDESSAAAYEMNYTGGVYSLTLTDTNQVLDEYLLSASDSKVNLETDGNKLTISSSEPFDGTLAVTAEKETDTQELVVWGDGVANAANKDQIQDIVFGEPGVETVAAYADFRINTGDLEIVKTAQHYDGSLAGFLFEVRGAAHRGIYH